MPEIEKWTFCTCTSVPLQLLSKGFFACAPNEPTLAVDITILDFVQELFVNTAPNTTAWCETLENFLDSWGFKLTTRVSCFFFFPGGHAYNYSMVYRVVCVIASQIHFAGTQISKISRTLSCVIIWTMFVEWSWGLKVQVFLI